jgi:hypothetical protein
MTVNIELLVAWLKDHNANQYDGNMILDGLEELYGLETEIAKQLTGDK